MMAIPTVPPTWGGSKPEFYIYSALIQLGFEPDKDFQYQSAFEGGRLQYGGVVADFVLPNIGIAINVQSIYWHYAVPTEIRQRDEMTRAVLEGYGLQIIYIDEDHALVDPAFYVKEALRGVDHSRMGGLR